MNKLFFQALLFVLTSSFFLSSTALSAEQTIHIAMLLWRGETAAEAGFLAGLKEKGYTVEYSIFDAEQNLKKLGSLLAEMSKKIDDYDYVYTFGTTVSRRTKVVVNERIPQIFNAVTDPVGAGIVASMKSTGGRISGASDAIPLSLQLESLLEVMEVNKLGFFFNPREKNSMLIRRDLYEQAQIKNIEVTDFRSPPAGNVLEKNLQQLVDNPTLVDAVFLPSDSFLVSKAPFIGQKLIEGRIKSFGSTKEYITGGVLMGIVVDYFSLGKSVAAIVDNHLHGKELQDIPVEVPENYDLMINNQTRKLLGISLSETLQSKAILYD